MGLACRKEILTHINHWNEASPSPLEWRWPQEVEWWWVVKGGYDGSLTKTADISSLFIVHIFNFNITYQGYNQMAQSLSQDQTQWLGESPQESYPCHQNPHADKGLAPHVSFVLIDAISVLGSWYTQVGDALDALKTMWSDSPHMQVLAVSLNQVT